jgi:phosphoribosylanthranilate isomerase
MTSSHPMNNNTMKKELRIKVCGMRDPENISGIVKAAPDYLGFIFYPKSKRFVGENPASETFNQVPGSILKAGVFVNELQEKVIQVCKEYGIQIAQLHGKESPEYCKSIQQEGIKVFKAFSVDDKFDFKVVEPYTKVVDYFLFDTKGKLPGGTGLKFNWDVLKEYQQDVPFFLSGGIGPDDLGSIMNFNHPALYGIDINSGFEIEPALKDVEKVSNFIKSFK